MPITCTLPPMRIMPGTRASISSAVPADSSGVPSIRVIIAPSFIFVLGACDFTTTSWRLSIYVMESFSCVWALAVIDADRAAMMAMVLMSVIGLLTLFCWVYDVCYFVSKSGFWCKVTTTILHLQ